MRSRRLIEFLTLAVLVLVVTTGGILTYRISQNLVLEEISPELWLWVPYQQDREYRILHNMVNRIALGEALPDDAYVLRRDIAISRLVTMEQAMERLPERFAAEQPRVQRIRALTDAYTVLERDSTTAPTPEEARELLPILDEILLVSQDLLNERRTTAQLAYIQAEQGVDQLLLVQLATLGALFLAGGGLFWLTHTTLSNQLHFAQAQTEAAESYARKIELVYHSSLVLSSRLEQQEILTQAMRVFPADYISILLFDNYATWGTVVASSPASPRQGGRVPLSGHPVVAHLLEKGSPLLQTVPQARKQDTAHSLAQTDLAAGGIATLLTLPLISRDQLIGAIELGSIEADIYDSDEQGLYLTVAASVAGALENARLLAAEQDARRTADTLREVARVLNASFDPDEVLQLMLRELQKVVDYDSASMMLVHENMAQVAAWRSSYHDTILTQKQSFPLTDKKGILTVLQRQNVLMIEDTRLSPYWSYTPTNSSNTRSWLGVPLVSQGTVIGVLNINARTPHHFNERDIEVARTFADQAAVALERARLYQESVTRVERELEIARTIQSNLFPKQLPQLAGLHVAAVSQPARETGGDFYDVVALPEQRLAVMIGDASGKSIPGAMLMAVARSTVRSEAIYHSQPEDVLQETNRLITADVPQKAFVALGYAIIDSARCSITLANAGQLAPLRYTAGGVLEYLEVDGPNLPLGIIETTRYRARNVALDVGDVLLFYTDGVVEAQNGTHELFGFERLERLVYDHGQQSPQELVTTIMQAVGAFAGNVPQHDDMTLVAVRVAASQHPPCV